jgi:hypothetical protein
MGSAERPGWKVIVHWRTIFFGVNFGVTILFVIMCAVSVGESLVGGGSPGAFFGGACSVWPAIAFGVAEWCLYIRNARSLEQPLGVVCGLVGGLTIFAFVSNLAEAAVVDSSPGIIFWLIFGAVCFSIAAYSLWCCWLRVRRRTFPEQRGFPVGPATTP